MNFTKDRNANLELDELVRLKELYENGDISQEEYENRKAYILRSPDYVNFTSTPEEEEENQDSFSFEHYRGFIVWGGIALVLFILLIILTSCVFMNLSSDSYDTYGASTEESSSSKRVDSEESESNEDTSNSESDSSSSSSSSNSSSSSSSSANSDEIKAYQDLLEAYQDLNTIIEDRNSFDQDEIVNEIKDVQTAVDSVASDIDNLSGATAESLSLVIDDMTDLCDDLTAYYESTDTSKSFDDALTNLAIVNQQFIEVSNRIIEE